MIWIEGITLGHVSKSLAYDVRTAPKEFELWALDDSSQDGEGALLLEGTYNINSSRNIQEFPLSPTKSRLVSQVLFKIKSNHGNPNLTRVYRVQIHGEMDHKTGGNDSDYLIPT
ncbi:hypothetical protein PGT21_036835 [Puccinia graminis f. sp. tritici]|nr:hypothetical protein PGT21_036835 [Puccinia graminis f. sp. tritici]